MLKAVAPDRLWVARIKTWRTNAGCDQLKELRLFLQTLQFGDACFKLRDAGDLGFQCGDFCLCFRATLLDALSKAISHAFLVAVGDSILIDYFLVGHLVEFRQHVRNCLLSAPAEIILLVACATLASVSLLHCISRVFMFWR